MEEPMLTGDEAYEILNALDENSVEAVMNVINQLTDGDSDLAENAFTDAQEAFVKGIHAGGWMLRNGQV